MLLTFGLTCRTTVSCFIRMDWIPTGSREKHRSAHTHTGTSAARTFLWFFLSFTVFAQSAHFLLRDKITFQRNIQDCFKLKF